MDMTSSSVTLSLDEYKELVNGRFKVFKCQSCEGKGWYWVHEDGYKRAPANVENYENFYKHPCEDIHNGDCGGAGFNVVFSHLED